MTDNFEHGIQCALIKIARTIPGAEMIYAIPNAVPVRTGGMSKEAAKIARIIAQKHMTAEGRKPGVLDVFNPKPSKCGPWRTDSYHGLYMETKRPAMVVDGKKKPAGKLTEEQAKFILYADANGYAVAVYYSAQEGIDILQRYLRGDHDNGPAVELARKRLNK